ncbi:MAG TPA: monovalent cation/H+ antiporter complex subunit F [Thermodesulfobacteriota bacterium]|nr:monovalent cation/H+ antiporter complex subunit F [Thermodesulfobacteriota bacterium]
MEDFFLALSLILGFFVLLCLYRVVRGPGVFNRIVGVNVIGTKTLVILALMGFLYKRVDMFVDICLVYALLNFISTLAAAKYFQRKGAD